MNYYNPYFFNTPSAVSALSSAPRVGLLTRLFGRTGTSIGSFLNGTQRVLNFANQAIPFVKQVKPMIGNAKTMFKVMNEFKRAESPLNINKNSNPNYNINTSNFNNVEKNINTKNNSDDVNEGPTFFM